MSLRPLVLLGLIVAAFCALSLGMPTPATAQDDPALFDPSGRQWNATRAKPKKQRAPDASTVTPLFGQQDGVVNGKRTDAALFQSSLIPVANRDMAEIVNYDCRYPRDASSNIAGQPVPESAIAKLGAELAKVKDLKGEDLKNALIAIKDGAGNGDIKDFVFVTTEQEQIYRNLKGTGCELNSQVNGPDVSFTEIFTNPIGFLQDVAVNLGTSPFRSIYNFSAPSAMRYAFFTPHAERGETLYSVMKADGKNGGEWYDGNTPLGFDRSSIDEPEKAEEAPWIRTALWVRWFLGGFFVLIIVVVGFMYMVSRNPTRQRQVLRVLPRLLLATLLMLAIGPIMGWAISTSNLVTAQLFDISSYQAASCVGNGEGLQEVTMKARNSEGCGMLSTLNSRIEYFMNNDAPDEETGSAIAGFDRLILGSLVLVSASLFFFLLLLLSVGRQVLLVLLVAVSPAACFAITFPKTQTWATRWGQAFLVVCLAPAAMALVLFFGLTIAGAAASVPILWFALMLVTFFAVWKIPLMMKGWITGRSGPSATTRVLGGASKAAAVIPGAGTGVAAALAGAQNMSQRTDNMSNRASGSLSGGPAMLGSGAWTSAGRRRANPQTGTAVDGALAEIGAGDGDGRRRGEGQGMLAAGAGAVGNAARYVARRPARDPNSHVVDADEFKRIQEEMAEIHWQDAQAGLPRRPEQYDLQRKGGEFFVRDRSNDGDFQESVRSWRRGAEKMGMGGSADWRAPSVGGGGAVGGGGGAPSPKKQAPASARAAREREARESAGKVSGGGTVQSTGDTTTTSDVESNA